MDLVFSEYISERIKKSSTRTIFKHSTTLSAMNVKPKLIKARIAELKVQEISHQQQIEYCDRSISSHQKELKNNEEEREKNIFYLQQIANELEKLNAMLLNEPQATGNDDETNTAI